MRIQGPIEIRGLDSTQRQPIPEFQASASRLGPALVLFILLSEVASALIDIALDQLLVQTWATSASGPRFLHRPFGGCIRIGIQLDPLLVVIHALKVRC